MATAKQTTVVDLFTDLTDEKLATIHQRLLAPFKPDEYDVRPGAVSGTRAQPLFYIDPRVVIHRLNKVFGFGGWSCPNIGLQFLEETVTKKDWKTGEETIKKGLLTGVTAEIHVHRGDLKGIFSNVGEKNPNDNADNKLTASWAQAFKRAATMMGIGTFLYCIKLPDQPYDKSTRNFSNFQFPSDEVMEKALKDTGFLGLCEETGEKVPWKVAAYSMDQFGKVLSVEAAKKLKGG
jgi:hypothetical protein